MVPFTQIRTQENHMADSLLHWEDFIVGQILEYGPHTVTKEEIIEFATQFDPQPMHLSEEAGKATMLGGLSASGWQTCSLWMKMFCKDVALKSTSLGSPGMDEMIWRRPVMAGDTLRGRSEVLSTRVSKSRPWMGFCDMVHETLNQRGDVVMIMRSTQMLRRRNAPEASA